MGTSQEGSALVRHFRKCIDGQCNVMGLDRNAQKGWPFATTRGESRSYVNHACDALRNEFAVSVTDHRVIGKTRGSIVSTVYHLFREFFVLYFDYKMDVAMLSLPGDDWRR